MNRPDSPAPACGCCGQPPVDASRRRVIRIASASLAAPLAMAALPAAAAAAGDRLVEEDAEGAPQPLRLSDLKPGKPLVAWPLDTQRGAPRDETRLNKIVLIRLTEAEMAADTRARAAGGVLAYSAVCTHQGCDVKTWLSKEKALVCYCHSSKFALLDGGAVVGGPATRALPAVPLRLEGDQLVIAGAFTAPPGGAPA
ncbi:QcrA and Rieske domain-containing protein [Ideonella alba]|uniref:Rieske (2Fe-2S) protein n=1 Tax=Ideonella alba TaxID=2824118 RepID=A0A940YGI2_9BURK|nr:Rieske (2Fe-2S) protein [Ideonella alba]MBQ0932067.1 Rieske (2Fe-2S) protein [Ideonella alba]